MRTQTEDSYAQTNAKHNYRPGSPENPQQRRANSVSWKEKATSVDNVDQPWWRRLGRWFAHCWKGRNRSRNGRPRGEARRRGSKERAPVGPSRDRAQRSSEKLDQDGERRGHSRKAERGRGERSRDRRKRSREAAPRSKGRRSRDFTKTCCYLCAQNSMAIAAASTRIADIADTGVQAEITKMANGRKMAETVEKSCATSVNVRTTEVGTVCTRKRKKRSGLKIKRKSFWPFTRYVKCPGRGTVPCQTEKTERVERKSGSKRERCCGERNN